MCASAILRLARTIRLPMVGSATRKARAVSPGLLPPEPRRERAARRRLERRVAAREDQPETIVDDGGLVVHGILGGVQAQQLGQSLGAVGHRPAAAQAIDSP